MTAARTRALERLRSTITRGMAGIGRLSRRSYARAFEHPLRTVEIALALGLFTLAFAQAGVRAVAWAVLAAILDGFSASAGLLAVDPGGAIGGAAWATFIGLSVAAPILRLFVRLGDRSHRRAWLPLVALVYLLALPMSFAAFSTVTMVVALLVAAALGLLAAHRPRLRLVALAPLVLMLEPMLGHSPLADLAWTRSRLADRCAHNDGRRAVGFTVDQATPRYYGITPIGPMESVAPEGSDRLVLLTGDRIARWMRYRAGSPLEHIAPSEARGNLWQGCTLDGRVWLTKRGVVLAIEPPNTPPTNTPRADEYTSERITRIPIVQPPGLGIELDMVDAVCDPQAHAIYASELLRGGVRVIPTDGGPVTRRDLGAGRNLQLVRRRDGLIVGIDTARLYVWDPRSDRMDQRITERLPAGLSVLGQDVCAAGPDEGTVAVTDFAGRLRLFRRAPDGTYRFERARWLRAPRRVAFSPDCRRLAVTSGDDRTVWILGRADLAILREHHVGPGLRDLVYLAPDELAIADACGAVTLEGQERPIQACGSSALSAHDDQPLPVVVMDWKASCFQSLQPVFLPLY